MRELPLAVYVAACDLARDGKTVEVLAAADGRLQALVVGRIARGERRAMLEQLGFAYLDGVWVWFAR